MIASSVFVVVNAVDSVVVVTGKADRAGDGGSARGSGANVVCFRVAVSTSAILADKVVSDST